MPAGFLYGLMHEALFNIQSGTGNLVLVERHGTSTEMVVLGMSIAS